MLNRKKVEDELNELLPFQTGKGKNYKFGIINSRPFKTSLGYRLDPKPFQGQIVGYSETFMVVELKPAVFRVVDLELVKNRPVIGTKVCVMPYERRNFAGKRIDEPQVETVCQATADGREVSIRRIKFGIESPTLPFDDETEIDPEITDLIQQIQHRLAPDGFRTLAQVLVDANANDFSCGSLLPNAVNDSLPSVKFKVKTTKFSGFVTIFYSHFFKAYGIAYQRACEADSKIWPIRLGSLCEKLVELIDDERWQVIRIRPIKSAKCTLA